MPDKISQGIICVFGLLAIIMVARKNKWGFVVGLFTQPFWYYTTYLYKQWGLFILSVAYTLTWLYGIYEWFFKKTVQDADVKLMTKGELCTEVMRLREGIRLHRDEKGNDRCWLDDQRLYQHLPEGKNADTALPPKDEFLRNCQLYHAQRQKPEEVQN